MNYTKEQIKIASRDDAQKFRATIKCLWDEQCDQAKLLADVKPLVLMKHLDNTVRTEYISVVKNHFEGQKRLGNVKMINGVEQVVPEHKLDLATTLLDITTSVLNKFKRGEYEVL